MRIKDTQGSISNIAINISIASIVFILIFYILYADYKFRVEGIKKESRFVADILALQITEDLDKVKMMLLHLDNEIHHRHFPFDTPLNTETSQVLHRIKKAHGNIKDILVINKAGEIIQWTSDGIPPKVLDRSYVKDHLNKPVCSKFLLSENLASKVHPNLWFFSLSTSVCDENNRLKYILVAIVDDSVFKLNLKYESTSLKSSAILTNKSGVVATSYQGHHTIAKKKGSDLISMIPKNKDRGGFIYKGLDGGVWDEFFGYKKIKKYDLIIFTGISKYHIFLKWKYYIFLLFLVLIALITIVWKLISANFKSYRKIEMQHGILQTAANTDILTGLYNRRFFAEQEKIEKEKSKYGKYQLSYMLLDIDNFKLINDTHGHEYGDQALKLLANTIKQSCRPNDFVCRYGGEEFIILLPKTSPKEAVILAERIRYTVEEMEVYFNSIKTHLTISIGVSSYSGNLDDTTSNLDAIIQADNAMYKAKKMGKNRVCVIPAN